MLFALRHPAILLGLVVGFLVGVALRAAVQQRLATPRLRLAGRTRGRGLAPAGWSTYLDPYGTVAAVVAGAGWGARTWARGRGRGGIGPTLAAVVVHGALAVAGFAGYRAAGGLNLHDFGISVTDVLHGSVRLGDTAAQVSAGFAVENLACGLLALTPVPPLELGVLLWNRLPRSPGARRFAYHLTEEAWGVAVALVALLLPLAGQQPALLALIDAVAGPLLRLV